MPPELMQMLAESQGQGNLAQPGPQDPMNQQLPPEIMEMLMMLLTQAPEQAVGGVPQNMPTMSAPGMAQGLTQQEQEIGSILQMLQQGQMQQGGQQMMNGAQGGMGAMYGAMGGRPPGM